MCVLCRRVQWVQVTEIYSAGRWTLDMKLGHTLQDSLSCHLCSHLPPSLPPTLTPTLHGLS